MVRWKLIEVAERAGITSSYKLQQVTGLPPTSAVRLWRGDVSRYSADTLNKLCAALNCQPGDLLEYTPDSPLPQPKAAKRKR